MISNRGLGIKFNEKKCLYEGVIVPMALTEQIEAWGKRSAERRNGNVLEMKCSRSLVGERCIKLRSDLNSGVCQRVTSERRLLAALLRHPEELTIDGELTSIDDAFILHFVSAVTP